MPRVILYYRYISMVDHNILTLLGGIDESERGTNLCNLMIRLVLHSSCIYFNLRYLCFRLSFFFYIIIQDGLTISLGLIVRANFQTNSKLKNTNTEREMQKRETKFLTRNKMTIGYIFKLTCRYNVFLNRNVIA